MNLSSRGGDPVFVDGSGRRRRLFVVAGAIGGLVLVLVALALVAGFTGVGPGSVPGWPGAGQVQGAVPKPRPSSTAPGSVAPPAGAGTSVRTTAGVPRSTTATTTAPAPPAAPAGLPPPSTAAPATSSHRRVPTQTPTAHPSKRH